MSAIDDSNDHVCAAAVHALGFLGAVSACDQITALLDASQPRVVSAAINSLARLGSPGLKERLVSFMESESWHVRRVAVIAIGRLGYTEAGSRLLNDLKAMLPLQHQRDIPTFRAYIETLARLQWSEAILTLTQIAEHEVGLRSYAVRALMDLNADSAPEILTHMLADPSSKLKNQLLSLIVKANFRKALTAVRPLLEEQNVEIRHRTLRIVTEWQDFAALDRVRWMCHNDPNPYIRADAIDSLIKLTGRDSLPDLLNLAHDPNTRVLGAVAAGLGGITNLPAEAVSALRNLANDEWVGDVARSALAELDHNSGRILPLPIETQRETLVPEGIISDMASLLTQLESWQAGLSAYLASRSVDQIADIDAALTTLIVVLRQAKSANMDQT
jgi:HEAT repeat protein